MRFGIEDRDHMGAKEWLQNQEKIGARAQNRAPGTGFYTAIRSRMSGET
jgi:hypothetical protein